MSSSANLKDFSSKPSSYFTNLRNEMLEFLPDGISKVLDVGCGEGDFGASIKRRMNIEVWGIELDSVAATRASDNIDKVLLGDLQEKISELPKKYFDCIIFNDVLEHLVNPYAVLEAVKLNLKGNGFVVCSIPNVRHCRILFNLVFRKQWRYEDSGILDKTHLRFFTEKSIKDMFENLDYEIVKMKGINRTNNLIVKLINLLFFGWFSDTLYYHYGCLVRCKR